MALLTGINATKFSQYTADQFTGNGVQTTFTLSRTPPSPASLLVTIDGVKQHSNTFSLGTNQIIFSEAPPNGSGIECIAIGSQGVAYEAPDSSITAAKLTVDSVSTIKVQDLAITAPKLGNGSVTQSKLDIFNSNGTGGVLFPAGTTAERPASPVNGISRYNSSLGYTEEYNSNIWNISGSIVKTTYAGSRENGRIAYTGGSAATFFDQTSCPSAITAASSNSKLLWFASINGSCDGTHIAARLQYSINGGAWTDCQPYSGGSGGFTITWQSNANNSATAGTYGVIPKGAYTAGATIDFRMAMYSPQSYEVYLGGSDSDWSGLRFSRGNHILIETIV